MGDSRLHGSQSEQKMAEFEKEKKKVDEYNKNLLLTKN